MKIEIHKGVTILFDPKKAEYYTEVVFHKRTPGKSRYATAKDISVVRSKISQFLIGTKKKRSTNVFVKGDYEDSRYHKASVIFKDNQLKTLTVRFLDTGRIKTIALSDYKYEKPKVFNDTSYNKKTIEAMERNQKAIESLRKERAELKLTLSPFKSRWEK